MPIDGSFSAGGSSNAIFGSSSFEADGVTSISFAAILSPQGGFVVAAGSTAIAFVGSAAAPPSGNPGSVINLNSETPAPPSSEQNVLWQADTNNPRNVSAYDPVMVGDAGSGGKAGNVPAPLAGSYEAQMFLRADGNWAIPPSVAGNFAVEVNGTQIASTANAGFAFEVEVNDTVIATYSNS
jgi:hypothetical protein